jgi:hypothetical protein
MILYRFLKEEKSINWQCWDTVINLFYEKAKELE